VSLIRLSNGVHYVIRYLNHQYQMLNTWVRKCIEVLNRCIRWLIMMNWTVLWSSKLMSLKNWRQKDSMLLKRDAKRSNRSWELIYSNMSLYCRKSSQVPINKDYSNYQWTWKKGCRILIIWKEVYSIRHCNKYSKTFWKY